VFASTAVGKFRAACDKWRAGKCKIGGAPCTNNTPCTGVGNTCLAHCRDEDIAAITGHGHLLSGAGGNAPPAAGDAGKFLCDWILTAKEKLAIKQQLFLIPDTVNLLSAMQSAGPEKISPTSGIAAKKGTSCSLAGTDLNTQEYRPNLCRFGAECRDHACTLAGTSQATLLSAPLAGLLGGPATLNLSGSVVIEFCQLGQATGNCFDAPKGPCETNTDCPTSPTNKCNLNRAEGLGSQFGAETGFIYLINEPSKTIKVTIPPALAGLVAAVCVDNVRSEGWCDCTGHGITNNTSFCQDGFLSDNGGPNDDCGSPLTLGTPSPLFPGTLNGAIKITPSGASAAGDCLDLQTTQFTIILATSDFGTDGLACTGDDFGAPSAPAQLPITTGTAVASIKDAVASPGTCNLDGAFCVENANCVNLCSAATAGTCSADGLPCTGGPGVTGTCNPTANQPCAGGPTLTDIQVGPLTGAKTNCNNYSSSNLSGLSLVGAFPALGTDFNNPLGDSVTGFKLTCN
jgi:hypothetical protein